MNDSVRRRRFMFILLMVGCVILVIVSSIYKHNSNSKRSKVGQKTVTIDKDTGEKIVTYNGATPETGNIGGISLIGSSNLYNLMAPNQFDIVKQQIDKYVTEHLSKDVKIVKVLPETVKNNSNTHEVTAELKIDQPLTSLSLHVILDKAHYVIVELSGKPVSPNLPQYRSPVLPNDYD